MLTKCWVCREGAVPLRCWMQGNNDDSMRGRRERRVEGRRDGVEGGEKEKGGYKGSGVN